MVTISRVRIFIINILLYKIAFLFYIILTFVAAKVNIKEAEILLHAGVLVTPVIKKHDRDDGWIVTLAGKHNLNQALETARGQVRVFKRLDAAVGVLFELGFEGVNVVR
jgi:hypothetical protein